MERRRIFHKATFAERLAAEAQRLRDQAKALPNGVKRELLLRRARQTEAAADINAWLTGQRAKPPKTVRP